MIPQPPQQEQDDYQDVQPMYPSVIASAQHAEFLKWMLDNDDPLIQLQMDLQGQQVIFKDDKNVVIQSTPLVNKVLLNQILSTLKVYNTKTFVVTNLGVDEINRIVSHVAEAIIDLLETSRRYNSVQWKEDKNYSSNYRAFLEGGQQQILLMIEHTIFATLKRSWNAITLNKVTGMHTSQELKTDAQNKRNKGVMDKLGSLFEK